MRGSPVSLLASERCETMKRSDAKGDIRLKAEKKKSDRPLIAEQMVKLGLWPP